MQKKIMFYNGILITTTNGNRFIGSKKCQLGVIYIKEENGTFSTILSRETKGIVIDNKYLVIIDEDIKENIIKLIECYVKLIFIENIKNKKNLESNLINTMIMNL